LSMERTGTFVTDRGAKTDRSYGLSGLFGLFG
jgi:hypothetical protein